MEIDVLALLRTPRGRLTRIAEALGVTPWAVCKWRKVPAERVLAVERVTGIPRYKLRPDIYPPPTPISGDGARSRRFGARSGF